MRVSPFLVCAAVAALATTAAAQADRQTTAEATGRTDVAERTVLVCDTDAATARAFAREFGQTPRFMTAEQIRAAQASGERWETPRCISASEHARLRNLTSARAER